MAVAGCDAGPAADTGDPRAAAPAVAAPDRAERLRAAHVGVDWMLAHWREMPVGWAHPNLSRLARVIEDPSLSQRLAAAIREDAAAGRHHPIAQDLEDPAFLASERLTQTLSELLRRKETDGGPWQASARTIEQAIAADPVRFWRAVPLRHQPALVHLLDELDVAGGLALDEIVGVLRAAAEEKPASELAANKRYVYALTHVVLARSRYFRQPVDATPLAFAIPVLRQAIASRLAGSMNVFDLDLVGEAVASLQILRADDDAATGAARRRLIALQRSDGGWGTGEGATPRRIHPTFNAIVALVPPPAAWVRPGGS